MDNQPKYILNHAVFNERARYNGFCHMLILVINDQKKQIERLQAIIREMNGK